MIVFDRCVRFPHVKCIPTASLDELDAMLHEVNAELYRINEMQLIRAAISSKKVKVGCGEHYLEYINYGFM